MFIRRVELENYRNFKKLKKDKLDLPVLVLVEPNGVGKSNFLEAIYLLAAGGAPRVARIEELIHWGESFARIEVLCGQLSLTVFIEPNKKSCFINEKEVSQQELSSRLPMVLFQPADLSLLSGSPAARREFLNLVIGQYDYEYHHFLSQYRQLLKQRNQAFKESADDKRLFKVLEKRLSQTGGYIFLARFAFINKLNEYLSRHTFSVQYEPNPVKLREICQKFAGNLPEKRENLAGKVREFLREKYANLREKERQLGFSLIGPQRDDWQMFGRASKSTEKLKDLGKFGSRGQQRVAIIRLKEAESRILEQELSHRPILLLDDLFSELDSGNQEKLVDFLGTGQTFLTAVHLDQQILAKFPQNSRVKL